MSWESIHHNHIFFLPGRVAQSVTCLATDASLTADPGVASSIPARSHTFVEIDHEIISTVILLPSPESFKKDRCQLQAKVCAQSTGKLLLQACPGKSVVRWTDRPAMTIAVDLGRKATNKTKKNNTYLLKLVEIYVWPWKTGSWPPTLHHAWFQANFSSSGNNTHIVKQVWAQIWQIMFKSDLVNWVKVTKSWSTLHYAPMLQICITHM